MSQSLQIAYLHVFIIKFYIIITIIITDWTATVVFLEIPCLL